MRRDGKKRDREKGYFSVFAVVVITEMKVLEDLVSVDVRSEPVSDNKTCMVYKNNQMSFMKMFHSPENSAF